MAASNNESSNHLHFTRLLQQQTLRPEMEFKSVEIIEVEFGDHDDNAINTSNFIDKVMEFSQRDKVKETGGFMVLRPKNGSSIFTKGTSTTNTTHSNSNNVNTESNPDKMEADNNNNHTQHESAWTSIPSLHAFQDKDVLYEIQKSSNWKVPLFAWNADHKKAVITQNQQLSQRARAKQQASKPVVAESSNPLLLHEVDPMFPSETQSVIGQKRKNADNHNMAAHARKRQKLDDSASTNPDLESAGFTIGSNDNVRYYNNKDLEFYRGFCCNTHKLDDYKRKTLKQYISDNETKQNRIGKAYGIKSELETKYLIFLKHLFEGNCANYGHIEAADGVSCYHPDSPFKAEDLVKFGPFSCLKEEELTAGVHKPYIYIGQSHTFFPWHVEDLCFHAMNHLLYGGDKVWYCISKEDYSKVMSYFRKQFKYYYVDCLTPLQHKNTIMDPYIFTCLGINVYCIQQKVGDIVIAPPGGLHCGLNESFNIAESINFMSYDDNQWNLSLNAMLIHSLNYHDCSYMRNHQPPHKDDESEDSEDNEYDNHNLYKNRVLVDNYHDPPCVCCNKTCTNPEQRHQCKCKYCDTLKCPCDYSIYLDINELANRFRDKYPTKKLPSTAVVPVYNVHEKWTQIDAGYDFEIYHPRKMSYAEIQERSGIVPKCKRELIYPTQDRKDFKFYPAICYNNRIIKRDELYLSYVYQMDFIGFGAYFQICDDSQIVTPGDVQPEQWTNPPIERQHGFYSIKGKRNTSKAAAGDHTKSVVQANGRPVRLKGTPSFDFLKPELNEHSPLIGTEWQHKKVQYAYPPGARKYNLEIRKKRVLKRRKEEKQHRIALLSSLALQEISTTTNSNSNVNSNDRRQSIVNEPYVNAKGTGINVLQKQQIDITQCDDDAVATHLRTEFSTEEYKDTPSPPTSDSERVIFGDDDDDEDYVPKSKRSKDKKNPSNSSDSDDAWMPDTNRWHSSLPEYQYQGLRTKGQRARSRKNTRSSATAPSSLSQAVEIMEIPKRSKKKKKSSSKKKKKSSSSSSSSKKRKRRKHDAEMDESSENEFVLQSDDEETMMMMQIDEDVVEIEGSKKSKHSKKHKSKKKKKEKDGSSSKHSRKKKDKKHKEDIVTETQSKKKRGRPKKQKSDPETQAPQKQQQQHQPQQPPQQQQSQQQTYADCRTLHLSSQIPLSSTTKSASETLSAFSKSTQSNSPSQSQSHPHSRSQPPKHSMPQTSQQFLQHIQHLQQPTTTTHHHQINNVNNFNHINVNNTANIGNCNNIDSMLRKILSPHHQVSQPSTLFSNTNFNTMPALNFSTLPKVPDIEALTNSNQCAAVAAPAQPPLVEFPATDFIRSMRNSNNINQAAANNVSRALLGHNNNVNNNNSNHGVTANAFGIDVTPLHPSTAASLQPAGAQSVTSSSSTMSNPLLYSRQKARQQQQKN